MPGMLIPYQGAEGESLMSLPGLVTRVLPSQIPTVDEAVSSHESSGSHLTREVMYGRDPITEYPGLQALRERDFVLVFPSMGAVFEDVLHGRGDLLKEAILHFMDLNNRYASLIT